MDTPDFIDVYPDTVVRAGQATSDTSGSWRTWGTRIRVTLESAESELRNGTIYGNVETYAERVVSDANRVGQQVANLGTNTATAGVVVAGVDAESEVVLHHQTGAAVDQGSMLNRPVNL